MTYRTFRIRQMTCMACGHPQRCKFTVVGDVETAPGCHSCGESDQWMSDIATPPIPSQASAYIERFQELVRQARGVPYRVFWEFDSGAQPFLSPAIDEMTTSITWEALTEFLDAQGIDIDYGSPDDEDDE